LVELQLSIFNILTSQTTQATRASRPRYQADNSFFDYTTTMDGQALENNAGGLGLFGDDDEEENEHQQIQQQQYEDDLDADDILGLDDDAGAIENPEGSLLMRFCPHDSSMLYPKV
jgi:hypothetical protein